MTIDQFRERMASNEPIVDGSDLHMEFHKFSQEALRITAEINGRRSIPIAARTRMSANGCSSIWAVSSKTKAVSSSTTMPSSVITPRYARSIIYLIRRNGQA